MFWKYKTFPRHLFDYVLWFLLRPIMIVKADGKISHWWHWKDIPLDKGFRGIKIKGDPNMPARSERDLISLVKVSLGGWKNCFVVKPNDHTGIWFFAFKNSPYTFKRCSIQLSGPCRILQGNRDYRAYGMNTEGSEISLEIIGFESRKEKRSYPLI